MQDTFFVGQAVKNTHTRSPFKDLFYSKEDQPHDMRVPVTLVKMPLFNLMRLAVIQRTRQQNKPDWLIMSTVGR